MSKNEYIDRIKLTEQYKPVEINKNRKMGRNKKLIGFSSENLMINLATYLEHWVHKIASSYCLLGKLQKNKDSNKTKASKSFELICSKLIYILKFKNARKLYCFHEKNPI